MLGLSLPFSMFARGSSVATRGDKITLGSKDWRDTKRKPKRKRQPGPDSEGRGKTLQGGTRARKKKERKRLTTCDHTSLAYLARARKMEPRRGERKINLWQTNWPPWSQVQVYLGPGPKLQERDRDEDEEETSFAWNSTLEAFCKLNYRAIVKYSPGKDRIIHLAV